MCNRSSPFFAAPHSCYHAAMTTIRSTSTDITLTDDGRIASFAIDYFRTYPHLCASHAFVPVGKVCNCYPPRRVHAHLEELDSALESACTLDAAPGLRLNYREFGLDERSKEFILGIGR